MQTQPANAECDYCGLPLPQPLWGYAATSSHGPEYCCFGCRIAHAVTQETGADGAARWMMTRLGLAVFFSMNVMVFTFALWAYDTPGLAEGAGQTSFAFAALLKSICLLMSLPVVGLLGVPLAHNACQQLRCGRLTTDLLLAAGVLAAYSLSAVNVWRGAGPLYLEVGCTILVFVTLGRWLEATGKLRSTAALDQLQQLLPDEVRLVDQSGTDSGFVPLDRVGAGDRLRVFPGDRIPLDGRLGSPQALVDEQLVTGESWPVPKRRGDRLTGGTLNLDSDILLDVTASSAEGTLSRLMRAVQLARSRSGNYQKFADRVTLWFIPTIGLVSLTTLIVHAWLSGIGSGLLAAMSVVLIACPCALGIATPLAVWGALGAAARRGIAIQGGETLEQLAAAKAIRFDKTGTLTTGAPKVSACMIEPQTAQDEFYTRARQLAQSSRHAFSRAISGYLPCERVKSDRRWDTVRSLPGKGVYACGGCEWEPTLLGNRKLLADFEVEIPESIARALAQSEQLGQPTALLAWGGRVRGIFTFQEVLRPDAPPTLAACRSRGLDVEVLTGDHPGRGSQLSRELNVPTASALGPEEKAGSIRAARVKWGPVIMVGDGINDAVACAEADVGIALGCGADVTRESADVCLISDELGQIPWLLDLSGQTVRTIRRNLGWAFGYNAVGVFVAAAGWLHPAVAAVLMVGSSLYVIANSLRLAGAALDDRQLAGRALASSTVPSPPADETNRLAPGTNVALETAEVET